VVVALAQLDKQVLEQIQATVAQGYHLQLQDQVYLVLAVAVAVSLMVEQKV